MFASASTCLQSCRACRCLHHAQHVIVCHAAGSALTITLSPSLLSTLPLGSTPLQTQLLCLLAPTIPFRLLPLILAMQGMLPLACFDTCSLLPQLWSASSSELLMLIADAVPCCAVLCRALLCYAMLCYAMPCQALCIPVRCFPCCFPKLVKT